MKEWITKHKFKILIVVCMALLIMAGIAVCIHLSKDEPIDKSEPIDEVVYEFKHYQCEEPELLNDHDDIGVMVMDCDSADSFETVNNAYFTSKKNQYVQGTGAMNMVNMRYKHVNPSTIFKPIDISAYSEGSVHVSLYINDPKYLGNDTLNIELTSSGTADKEELEWNISPRVLKAGWNELYLGMDDAGVHGEVDLTAINYFRAHALQCKMGIEVYLDAVYATDKSGMDIAGPKVYATTKPGYLMDFDSLDGLRNPHGKIELSDKKGMYKEGVAAVTVTNPTHMWILADLKPTDITEYQKLSFWIHISNADYVRDGEVVVELTSSGKYDAEEINWTISGASLKTGWNEVTLGIGAASGGGIDLTRVNFFRVYPMNCSDKVSVTFDAIKLLKADVRVPDDGMIADCDTVADFMKAAGSITNAAGEYKQGTGALKFTFVNPDSKPKVVTWNATLYDLVDVSKYKDGGITFWLYIEDASKLESVMSFEIRSGATYDVDEYEWRIPGLKTGWNEVRLAFADAKVTGTPDLSRLYTMRMYGAVAEDVTFIYDAIRAIEDATEVVPDGTTEDSSVDGMIFSGDSYKYINMLTSGRQEITRAEGEYVQGTGAYKSMGTGNIRLKGVLKEAKDISAYKEGGIQFSLYIEDKSKMEATAMTLELTSAGKEDVEELEWRVDLTPLQNGWNTVKLKFDNVTGRTGEIDYTQVNFIRIFLNRVEQNPELVLIVDDIHAIQSTALVPVDGMIADCDTLLSPFRPGYVAGSITNKADEYKQGTGAIKVTCKNSAWWVATFEDVVDVSSYAEGGISFWLYVDDASKIRTPLKFEFRSGATYDVDEYEWQISELKNGWNEVKLSFDKASVSGTPDITKLCAMRLFGGNLNGEVTLMIDEIRAVESIVDDGTGEQPGDNPQENDNELTPGKTDEHSDKEWSPFI